MFSFKYSERPNTLASKRMPDDVTEEEKTRRIVALQALQRRIQSDLFERSIGRTRRGAGRLHQPPARLGAVGPHQRQHGGQLPGPPDVAGPVRRRRRFGAPGPNSVWGEMSGSRARPANACRSRQSQPSRSAMIRAHGMIEMNIKGLMVDPITNMPIIILRDQRRAEGAADLGRRVRGQRHRAADREHPDAAADDARPAAQRHPGPAGHGRQDRGVRPEGEHLLRADPSADRRPARSRSTPGRATRSPWRCARARRSWSTRRSSTTPRPSTSPTRSRTAIGCSSGSSSSTPTTWANTRCRVSAGRQASRNCRPADNSSSPLEHGRLTVTAA